MLLVFVVTLCSSWAIPVDDQNLSVPQEIQPQNELQQPQPVQQNILQPNEAKNPVAPSDLLPEGDLNSESVPAEEKSDLDTANTFGHYFRRPYYGWGGYGGYGGYGGGYGSGWRRGWGGYGGGGYGRGWGGYGGWGWGGNRYYWR